MTSYGMEYPCAQLGSAVLAVSPLNSLCTPSPLAGGVVGEAEKALTLCKHCLARTKTSLYVNAVSSTKSEHSFIPTAKKINSIPAQNSTLLEDLNVKLPQALSDK